MNDARHAAICDALRKLRTEAICFKGSARQKHRITGATGASGFPKFVFRGAAVGGKP